MKAQLIAQYGAQYSPSISGHCDACGLALNGRSTDKNHLVRVVKLGTEEFRICDRHINLAAATRKAHKRELGTDCGPVKIEIEAEVAA
jgi:hypothetical protein